MFTVNRRQFGLLTGAAIAARTVAASAQPPQPIKIGGLATLEGPLTELGKDGFRGLEIALDEFDNEMGGVRIELSRASSDSKPDVALASARRLVEQDKVDVLIGPLSGSEGIRIKDYAKTVPGVTFLNGSSAAVETTLVSPAPNFYRFNPDGAQTTAGLGSYIKKTKGWNKIVIVAEDYSFPYAQIMGLMGTFCAAGGRVEHKFFVPLGTKDYSAVIAQLPEKSEVDAMFVVLGGADAVNFLTQYTQSGGDLPIIGGSLTVDETCTRLERSGARPPARRPLLRSDFGQRRQPGVAALRGHLPQEVSERPALALVSVRRVLHQHQGGPARSEGGQRRPVRRAGALSRGAGHAEFRDADRTDLTQQEIARRR